MKRTLFALGFCWAALAAIQSQAITVGPFGPNGEGGAKNGQTFLIGPGGSVFEVDGYLYVGGQDLNGAQPGTTAALSRDSLPAGLTFLFSSLLATDLADITLSYTFSNATSAAFTDLRFFSLLDAEIDQEVNTFFNEFGTVSGTVGLGASDADPDQWQIDEPGFQFGTLFLNLFLGSLNNSNSIPPSASDDVAMGLGFRLGDLAPHSAVTLRVMVSENGRSLGSLSLIQRDHDANSTTFITLSGGQSPALAGWIFVDGNTNGVFDLGEGLTNVTVRLLTNGVIVLETTNDANGHYSFGSAPPGTYDVQVDPATLPPGLMLVPVQDGATGDPTSVTLAAAVPRTLNWGYRTGTGQLGGSIFVDGNTSGVIDPGEGLANVTVRMLTNGVSALETTSDASGHYSFTNVPPGNYEVAVDPATLPPGLTLAPVQDGATNNPTSVALAAGVPSTLNWGYQAATSEPGDVTALVQMGFTWKLYQPHGSLIGTLSLTNSPASGAAFGPPFLLGLHSSTNFYFVHPTGVLSDGLPDVDLTAAISPQLDNGALHPGQRVVVTNGIIEIYSRTRSAPPLSLFELWATRARGNPEN